MESLTNYPTLLAEDAGFLKHLQEFVLDKHQKTLCFDEKMNFCKKIELLYEANNENYGTGVTLPFYLPQTDDDGKIWGYKTVAVWSREIIDFPLYGNCAKEAVELFVFGKTRHFSSSDGWSLSEELMTLAPAFRVAFLTHYILQNVIIEPLAAEAFVLGSYPDLHFKDDVFEKTGIPSTSLVSVSPCIGTSSEWVMDSPSSLHGRMVSYPKYKGWTIYVRGSAPKENVLRQAWQEIKNRGCAPRGIGVFVKGLELQRAECAPSGRTRERAGDSNVNSMVQLVDSLIDSGNFPTKGSRRDWKRAHAMIEIENPELAGLWTADSMRRIYEMRKQKEKESENNFW